MRRASLRSAPAVTGLRAGRPDLQTMVGNLAVRRLLSSTRGPLIQRDRGTTAARRQLIEDTITRFNGSATLFANPLVTMNRAVFDRVVNGHYAAVVHQEQIIDNDLGGDAALKARLRAAYIAAIRVVMTRAATALGKSEDDLYRENTGRIPMWAWRTPHHLEPGFSTPIAEGRTVDLLTGNVVFSTNGFDVTILPDRSVAQLSTDAETTIDISWSEIHYTYQTTGRGRRRRSLITHFDPLATPTVQIQTTYRRGSNQATPSGYGRGTTPEDVAGGAVDPRSTTLGFHEGMHGLAMVEYLEQHPPPQFRGTVGMTRANFEAEARRYRREWRAYSAAVKNFSTRSVDCVGTTIDQYNQAHRRRGQRIALKCGSAKKRRRRRRGRK